MIGQGSRKGDGRRIAPARRGTQGPTNERSDNLFSTARQRPRRGSNSSHLIDNQAASPDAYEGNVRACFFVTDCFPPVLSFTLTDSLDAVNVPFIHSCHSFFSPSLSFDGQSWWSVGAAGGARIRILPVESR